MSDDWLRKQVDKFAFDFDEADKDKSGTLSGAEVIAILRTAGFKGSDAEGQAIFEHLDLNNDNKITKDEFKDAIWRMPKFSLVEMNLRHAFRTMDTDGSGSLTKKELEDYFATNEGGVIDQGYLVKILRYIENEDDDKQVQYDEFLRQMEFDETKSVIHQIFSAIDRDGNGSISVQELKEAVEREGQLSKLRPRIRHVLGQHKGDKIDFHQFVVLWN